LCGEWEDLLSVATLISHFLIVFSNGGQKGGQKA
jgi:hypothetical protein